MSGFEDAVRLTLGYEGGFGNVADDHGGPTNFGVTQTVYDAWGQKHGRPPGSVAVITAADAEAIYREKYWDAGGCDSLEWPLSAIHFDACVNHGVAQASVFLAMAMWAPDQPVEREAFAYLTLRYYFYNRIVSRDPSQGKFLVGWKNRLDRLRKDLQL